MIQARDPKKIEWSAGKIGPARRHAVNVLFDEAEYVKVVREAADLTVREGNRVSLAEFVRRLTLSKGKDDKEGSRKI